MYVRMYTYICKFLSGRRGWITYTCVWMKVCIFMWLCQAHRKDWRSCFFYKSMRKETRGGVWVTVQSKCDRGRVFLEVHVNPCSFFIAASKGLYSTVWTQYPFSLPWYEWTSPTPNNTARGIILFVNNELYIFAYNECNYQHYHFSCTNKPKTWCTIPHYQIPHCSMYIVCLLVDANGQYSIFNVITEQSIVACFVGSHCRQTIYAEKMATHWLTGLHCLWYACLLSAQVLNSNTWGMLVCTYMHVSKWLHIGSCLWYTCLFSGHPRTDFKFKLSGVCLFVRTYMHVCCLHLLRWGDHETGGSLALSLNCNSIHVGIQLNKPIPISTRLQSRILPPVCLWRITIMYSSVQLLAHLYGLCSSTYTHTALSVCTYLRMCMYVHMYVTYIGSMYVYVCMNTWTIILYSALHIRM